MPAPTSRFDRLQYRSGVGTTPMSTTCTPHDVNPPTSASRSASPLGRLSRPTATGRVTPRRARNAAKARPIAAAVSTVRSSPTTPRTSYWRKIAGAMVIRRLVCATGRGGGPAGSPPHLRQRGGLRDRRRLRGHRARGTLLREPRKRIGEQTEDDDENGGGRDDEARQACYRSEGLCACRPRLHVHDANDVQVVAGGNRRHDDEEHREARLWRRRLECGL